MAQVPNEESERELDNTVSNGESGRELTDNSIDYLLRKYLRVWIWSIIFGLDTTLTLSLTTQGFIGRYTLPTSLILAMPSLASAVLVIGSWFLLAQFLVVGLVPLLWPTPNSSDEPTQTPDKTSTQTKDEVRYLTYAMLTAIFAVMLRAGGFLVEVTFGSLGRF
jgi:hypothetical protein